MDDTTKRYQIENVLPTKDSQNLEKHDEYEGGLGVRINSTGNIIVGEHINLEDTLIWRTYDSQRKHKSGGQKLVMRHIILEGYIKVEGHIIVGVQK